MIDSEKTSVKPKQIKRSGAKYDQRFYPNLVSYLNPVFNVSEEACGLLKSASMAYFQALVIIDGIIDMQKEPSQLMEAIGKIEGSIKGLSSVFDGQHPFWENFQENKETYFLTLKKEKQYSAAKKKLTEEHFDEVAMGKSAVCYSIVNALSYLSDTDVNDEELIFLLKEIHIAFQCKDDIDDFLPDLHQGQHTYAHELTLTEIRKANGDQEQITYDLMHRYFYVSGLAEKILLKGISHFQKARQIAANHRLSQLLIFLDQEIEDCYAQIKEINLLIRKTKEENSPKQSGFDGK